MEAHIIHIIPKAMENLMKRIISDDSKIEEIKNPGKPVTTDLILTGSILSGTDRGVAVFKSSKKGASFIAMAMSGRNSNIMSVNDIFSGAIEIINTLLNSVKRDYIINNLDFRFSIPQPLSLDKYEKLVLQAEPHGCIKWKIKFASFESCLELYFIDEPGNYL